MSRFDVDYCILRDGTGSIPISDVIIERLSKGCPFLSSPVTAQEQPKDIFIKVFHFYIDGQWPKGNPPRREKKLIKEIVRSYSSPTLLTWRNK